MKEEKIIVVGANHAGTSFLRTIKTLNSNANITAYDRNTNTSFLGCGIALWVGGEFKEPTGLFYSSPASLIKDYGINLHIEHEVIGVDRENKTVTVLNLRTKKEFKDSYDKLVFAGGTWPVEINIPGANLNNIVLSKLFQHGEYIQQKANDKSIKNVVVVGAGYIGVELVEAFHIKGKNVTLIDMESRVLPNYFDAEFTDELEKRMKTHKINMALGQIVQEFKSKDGKNVSSVVTNKGEYPADLVIMSIGFKPRTDCIDVEKLPNGAIKVDEFQRTISDPNIYALGDSAALKSMVNGEYQHVALATNAVKTGVVAATHLAGVNAPFPGVAGTNAINVFGCSYASTGFTLKAAKENGFKNAAVEYWIDNDRPEFMRSVEKVGIKVTYDKDSLRILGAQLGTWGKVRHTEAIYMFSVAIQNKMTLLDLALSDVYFLPHFNKPFNFMLMPLLNALGIKYKK
ncbi:NADH oxidase [Mycoplasmopsis californica]|uniref:FAD-dependent oxidoreductase n=1 Tax=Mycoplasmopsis equigenitalium TaxID=114883 RepID=A0ABY5J5F5_9BACT|nr:FAD-dependent oxidoreductase [Mycoplasmopsis equigenitalium]UUD37195.1 FAD-dependent oxidoreductase [Mycoplasmopsis equigenitalium]VEU69501.1 NADH oxidase [Mycoplasmopsis californica]